MSDVKDGGPAFPVESYDAAADMDTVKHGMSLRDWFAGQVLASAAALPFGEADYKFRAKVAYAQADAMLAARGGPDAR